METIHLVRHPVNRPSNPIALLLTSRLAPSLTMRFARGLGGRWPRADNAEGKLGRIGRVGRSGNGHKIRKRRTTDRTTAAEQCCELLQ